ncbi:PP2C family protein-serine/threonine phosphatase [Massilia cavernae]|uniref:Protein phosphatase n=1 Tax=Massilia cavernae TaxID=2320864 RepID=A0A418Y133_9BURK|nr:protein phosphatase 2C domain-containing protein [Massilia cavernae]RJG19184.1 protein phosphatase [Massilia cavernae]
MSGGLDFGPRLDVAAHSSVGAGPSPRLENQDNFLLIDTKGKCAWMHGQQPVSGQVDGWPEGHARVAVLDGMGGHGHGREAAEAAADGLRAMPACATVDELSARLEALHAALQRQFAGAGDQAHRPGTTLTLLELPPGQPALLFHAGDSRLYRIGRGKAEPLTIDHVPATAFAMAGLLREREWWQQVHGEHRPQISQAFILGNAFANPAGLEDPLFALTPALLPPFLRHMADRRAVELEPGCDYVLATDGFWSCPDGAAWVARWPALLAMEAGADSACAALFDAIERQPPRGLHSDNLTAIVLRVRPAASTDETALPGQPA